MKPTRIWLGLLFLGLGVFGVLDVTGVLAWNDTVGQWWPLAIIAFGVADMATKHRITFGQAIITAIGVALLADHQNWASDNLIWSLLVGGIGLGILFGRGRSPKPDHQSADREASPIGGQQYHGLR
jgi:hypothetical protein